MTKSSPHEASPRSQRERPRPRARAHLAGRGDALAAMAPLLEVVGDWRAFLGDAPTEQQMQAIRRHQRTGRPLGTDGFVERLEASLGRSLRPRKPGPKPTHHPAEA